MEARSAWCAFEGRVLRQVLPLFLSFVCFVSSILLALSLPLHRLLRDHLFDRQVPKAVWSPSRESSAASTGPCKGSAEGTAPGAGLAGASGAGAVFTSASSFLVSIFSHPSAYMCLYSAHWMYGAGLLPVRRDRLPLATRKVYSGFSTVFLLLLLLAVGVGFPAACFGR